MITLDFTALSVRIANDTIWNVQPSAVNEPRTPIVPSEIPMEVAILARYAVPVSIEMKYSRVAAIM